MDRSHYGLATTFFRPVGGPQASRLLARSANRPSSAPRRATSAGVNANPDAEPRYSTRTSLNVAGLGYGPFWLRCCTSESVLPSSVYV